MSNTIREPRKRPRVKSSNFRTLGWLIRREAAFLIVVGIESPIIERRARRGWALVSTRRADALAARALRFTPWRRYTP